MEKISNNISYKEATRSNTAIKFGIINEPDIDQLMSMILLADVVFQPLREWYGKPIRVNSFFRSEHLNGIIGGAKSSQHCKGEAIDIDTEDDNAKLFNYIMKNLEFDQLIWEFGDDYQPAWIHVSYKKEGNRGNVLRAVKKNGKTVYKNFKGV